MHLHYNLRLTPIAAPTAEADLFSHRKSGLEFTTATDGTSEWVRPEDVERFKRDGAALLGKEAQVNEGAISQLGVMHQQLTESQTAQNEAKAEKSKADAARDEAEAAREKAATEVETLRAELKAAREEATEAKSHGETEMARREAKSRKETEMARGVAEAAEGEKLDKHPGCRCSLL